MFHFKDTEPEAWRDWVPSPGAHSQCQGQGAHTRLSTPKPGSCWEGPWTATNPVPCFPDTETETAQKVSLGSAGPQASARVPCVLLGTSCSSLTVSLSKSIFNITTVLTSCKGSSPRRTKYVQKLFPKRTTLFFFSSSNKTV